MYLIALTKLFGAVEEGVATKDEQDIFRMMCPLLKLFTAKEVIQEKSVIIHNRD